MILDIGTEAAQFLEKDYINGIFLAVHGSEVVLAHKDGQPADPSQRAMRPDPEQGLLLWEIFTLSCFHLELKILRPL